MKQQEHQATEQLTGYIERITFYSPENAFVVAKLKIPKHKDLVTIIGTINDLQPGETLQCVGHWKTDPRHGQQFIVQSYEKKAPSTVLGIQKYLSSGLIKGIGPKYAEKIVDLFGLNTLSVIEHEPNQLLSIEGLGQKKLNKISESFKKHKSIQEVIVFLQSHDVTPLLAQKIYKQYGENSIQQVQTNPYQLARHIHGVGFKMADKIAKTQNISNESPARICAGIEFTLNEATNNGHVCLPKLELEELVSELLGIDSSLVEKMFIPLEKENRICIEDLEGTAFVWIKPLYLAERGITIEIKRLIENKASLRDIKTEAALKWASEKLKLRFAKEQKEAIRKATSDKLHIITGGPGTGKSTITKAILRITEKLTSKIVLAAPTGRAAKRMSEITYRHASTIHSLLEYDFRSLKFKRNHQNPILADLIIVDEASMIDTQLMYHLLKAIPNECRVIFIGDIDQLPSVGPGNVLRDFITSSVIPTTTLNFIFRQAKGSQITYNAYLINQGYFPKLNEQTDSDFFFIEEKEPEQLLETIKEVVSKRLVKKYHFDANKDIQVLAPMRKGIIGTEHLNLQLQETLNSHRDYLMWLGKRFALSDKVMQLKNNYQKEVYNGDIGIISSIDKIEQEMEVDFEGKRVHYEFSELDEINLAYCVSIHKYQGSEAPCIVMPIHTHHFKLLCRNLLYTGITRGKKLVVLIGTKKALAIAIKNNEVKKRYTSLSSALKVAIS